LLSPHAAVSSALGSEHQLDPHLDIVIPRSSSAGGGGFGLGLGGASLGGSDHNRGYSRSLFGGNEEGLLPDIDLGLDFEVEGNFVDNSAVPGGGRATSIHTPAPVMRDGVLPDSNADRDVVMYDDEPLPIYPDDIDMQDAEPFAPRTAASHPDNPASPQDTQAPSQTSHSTASAPAVRTRAPKPLPQDQQLELHNADLQTWDREYLATQSRASLQKLNNKTLTLARKNANFWVLQNGIGGLGVAYQGVEAQLMPEPLRMFSGTALLEALTGIQLSIAGTKHPRAIDVDEDEEQERRVRTRSNSHEVGRAADSNEAFETGFVDDTIVNTIEQGRDAPTPLPDIHSSAHALPWNHAAPASRGSSHHTAFVPPYPIFAPGAAGPSSSIAGGAGFSIRGRRTISASPLVGRGIPHTTAADDEDLLHDDTHFAAAFPATHSASAEPSAAHPSFDLFGPAAHVSTQLASTTPFLSAALTTESANFLAFVKACISEAKAAKETTVEAIASVLDVEGTETEDEEEQSVEFEVLLKPEENSRVVAAQGFLHVLTLVTKGLLVADQGVAFGGIELRVL